MRRGLANTHGVSSMTLHTLAMVLRQSVVFSIGNFLFSDTNFFVASLKVFSIGIASAKTKIFDFPIHYLLHFLLLPVRKIKTPGISS